MIPCTINEGIKLLAYSDDIHIIVCTKCDAFAAFIDIDLEVIKGKTMHMLLTSGDIRRFGSRLQSTKKMSCWGLNEELILPTGVTMISFGNWVFLYSDKTWTRLRKILAVFKIFPTNKELNVLLNDMDIVQRVNIQRQLELADVSEEKYHFYV